MALGLESKVSSGPKTLGKRAPSKYCQDEMGLLTREPCGVLRTGTEVPGACERLWVRVTR